MSNIMLVGIQGSGKGTQARKIVEAFGYALFETGEELRKIGNTHTQLGQEIRSIIDQGSYVPSRYIRDVISDFIQQHPDMPILFDSPIRTSEQDGVIRPILGDFSVIHLALDPELALERLLQRRIDPVTGEIFASDFVGDINPRTGNRLITRVDDNESAIKTRIGWSVSETLPLIDIWEQDGYPVYRIDADQPVNTIFSLIQTILKNPTSL